MRRRTLQPRSPPSYIGVRMPSLARARECDPRRRRRGYHAGKSPEDAKELPHESLQQKMRCGAMHVSRDHLAAGPADRSVPSIVFVDVVATASALKSFNHPCVLSLFSAVPQFE